MPVIGLLEGHRLKYRLGDPLISPEAWDANPGNFHQKEVMTTDWPAEYRVNPDAARAHYIAANAGTLDPEYSPTVEDFLRHNFPTVNFSQPAATDPVIVMRPNPVAQVETNFQPDPPTQTPLPSSEAKAIAEAARDARFTPVDAPVTRQDCGGRAGQVSCGPSTSTGGGRGPGGPASTSSQGNTDVTQKKNTALPIFAAIAAYFLIKG